jgi:hypothetical protein
MDRWIDCWHGCLAAPWTREARFKYALSGAELRQQTSSHTTESPLRLGRIVLTWSLYIQREFTGRLRQTATLENRCKLDSIPKEITGCLAWYHAQASESH